ncbi:MAG: 50S ribosomal protein L16 [Patescibacteria group bacterium]
MLTPRKVKHRKVMRRGKTSGISGDKINLDFGHYGLRALAGAWITARQIEAARRTITRKLQRGGKLWIRIFPDKPMSVKGNEVRMGGGKGSIDHYVAVVRPGVIMFEIDGTDSETAKEALRLAAYKLPVRTKYITR